jgi:hypothetical protein
VTQVKGLKSSVEITYLCVFHIGIEWALVKMMKAFIPFGKTHNLSNNLG